MRERLVFSSKQEQSRASSYNVNAVALFSPRKRFHCFCLAGSALRRRNSSSASEFDLPHCTLYLDI